MKYLFAVSGGPDSMAMLSMYHRKAQAVCIVNYKKREHSELDVKAATDFCDLYNIKYYIHNVTKKYYENHKNANFQSLAREIRYDFFLKVAKKEQNYHLMVAHNLNDHMETAYMQFNRNSKALFYGLDRKSTYHELKIKRPVLRFQKSTLERYCKLHDIKYVIDYTNAMDIYERNRARKIIMAWDSTKVTEFLTKIRGYNKKHKKLYKQLTKSFGQWSTEKFPINYYKNTSPELQYYLIYEYLKCHDEKNNSQNKIEAIMDFLLKSKKNSQYRLENGRFLSVENNYLKIKI